MSRLHPSLLVLDKGLDLQSAKLVAPEGSAFDMLNYEQVDFQGQKRIDGYARYDGSPLSALDDFYITEEATTEVHEPYVIGFYNGKAFGVEVDSNRFAVIDFTALPPGQWGRDAIEDPEEHYELLLTYNEYLRERVEELPGKVIGLHWFKDRLYAVADLQAVQYTVASVIEIDGELPGWNVGIIYNGQLDVANAVGEATVEQIGGDELPEGATITYNSTTKNIVVSWPATSELVEGRPYDLSLRITDELGRQAEWVGTIDYAYPMNIYATRFSSPSTYFAKWEEEDTFWTTDAGPVSPSGSVSLWAAGDGVLIRNNNVVSQDNGVTWFTMPITPSTTAVGRGVRTPSGTIVIPSASSSYSCIRSTDNGSTATAVPRNITDAGGGNHVLMLNSQGHIYRVAIPRILVSTDDGLTWSVAATAPGGVSMAPSTTNFVYGRQGPIMACAGRAASGGNEILLSRDDGATWEYTTIAGSGPVHKVTYNNTHWLVSADNGLFWSTSIDGPWEQSIVPDDWNHTYGAAIEVCPYSRGFLVAATQTATDNTLIYSPTGEEFELFPNGDPATRQYSALATHTP